MSSEVDEYARFLSSKRFSAPPCGIPEPPELSPKLFPFQADLVRWALRRGRSAIFADTGLGKGFQILEWSRVVAEHTKRPVLILAPLAVSQQFAREALKLGVGVTICSSQSDVRQGVNVTNYQKLHKFDVPAFGGVACDESSLLKSLDGKTRALMIEAFRATPFKLCATATPSPNDHTELGGHAEFLGIMSHAEMLASFFVNDGSDTQKWRLKGHARSEFWRWVCSWGAIVKMPSDLGYADDGYILPELRYHEHIVPATDEDARKSGLLFAEPASTLTEQRAARRGTLDSRVKLAADIANGTTEQVVVWCGLNTESEALAEVIEGAVEVTGSQDDDDKERRIEAFVRGQHRVLVSKARICGHGLNFQQCWTTVFCGVGHSWEEYYQAVRRFYRYGQERPVDVHIVSSELEGNVLRNLKEKQRKAEELSQETRGYVSEYVRTAVSALSRETIEYRPRVKAAWPKWLRSEESRA
jgi:superfamily II DNA or RNA helicase